MKIESVYLAAASCEIERAKRWTNVLTEAGIRCTSTWIKNIADTGGHANPRDAERPKRQAWSEDSLHAVFSADLLWMLVPRSGAVTCGAWWEAGHAHSFGKPLVFSGEDTGRSIFCALGWEFADDADAFKLIYDLVKRGVG